MHILLSANLGDIYDSVHDSFTAASTYSDGIPFEARQFIDGPTPVFSDFQIIHEYKERNSFLGVDTALATSAYLGLFSLDGRAQAAKSFKLRKHVINGLLSYRYKKGTIRLNTMSPSLMLLVTEISSRT